MDPDTVGQVIAERRYKLSTKSDLNEEVIVRLGAPQQSPGNGPFFCPFEIAGFGGARIKRIFGADAFQALQLTLKIIGAHLHYYRQSYGPGFYMDEEGDDLGFPAEAWTKGLGHRIATTLDPISGLKLSIARNAASMKNFQFRRDRARCGREGHRWSMGTPYSMPMANRHGPVRLAHSHRKPVGYGIRRLVGTGRSR
jgi:hypothetical protein